ncbi:hypothetical protein MKZ38_006028, partial [Zalerion maritima]
HGITEVAAAVSKLNTNLPKVRIDLPLRPASGQTTKAKPSSASQSPIDDCPRLPEFEFEAALHESTVYRRARGSECDRSPDDSVVNGAAWSVHGSDIPSVISVIALPLIRNELANPEFYAFSPHVESQIPSRPVSHLTLDALQAMAIARSASAVAPPSTADTMQSTSTSTMSESDAGRRSFSAECEGLGPKASDGRVVCMGSLYFNQDTQIWPSASEVGAQLFICATNGLLDDFMCSYCNNSLGSIVKSRRDHWTEHSVFCRPCGQQLKALHGSTFCPCTSPEPKLYVKYYNFTSSMSLVRCATCFSCCFGCSRPRLTPKHRRQATPTEHRIKRGGVSHSRSRTGLNNAHRRNGSEDSTVSTSTAVTSSTSRTSGTSPAPHRLRKRVPPPYVPLLPSPPTSPLDNAVPEASDEPLKLKVMLSPTTVLREAAMRGLETPPDSAQNTSHSEESEGELPPPSRKRLSEVDESEENCSPPPGHKPSGSRDYIMRIPEDTRDALMLRKAHKTSSSISKVYFKDKPSNGGGPAGEQQQTQQTRENSISTPLYWGGRILFHHDAGPCLKLLYNIPQQLQDKYRRGQFALAGTRGLLDAFKCKACLRDIWTILGSSTDPGRYLSYFMWCGRTDKCTAVDVEKCWTCGCHAKEAGAGKLHVGFLDALTGRVVVFCADCFEVCRDCRAHGNRRPRAQQPCLQTPRQVSRGRKGDRDKQGSVQSVRSVQSVGEGVMV